MDGMPFIQGEYQALPKRGISEDTCKKFGYQVGRVPQDYPTSDTSAVGKMKGSLVQIANFYEDGVLIGQSLRDKHKNFAVIGKVSGKLWGKSASPAGGKMLVITEGPIDALTYAEVRKGWQVVSPPNGADSLAKAMQENLPYLESFEKVIICLDNDDGGKAATDACTTILSSGKTWIGKLSAEFKDFNEALEAGDVKAIMNAVYQAEEYRPDGIVDIGDVYEEAIKPVEWGLPWFIPELTQLTYGRRYREIYALGAGTGVGKTDVFTEQVCFDVTTLGLPVGLLFLEQKPPETAKRTAGKHASKRFHVPDAGWTVQELKDSIDKLKGKVTFYDSFGQTDWAKVKEAIRHMNKAKGIRIFYLDHLTALASSTDERGSLEQITKEMAGLADELDIIIHFISHLATPDGTPHEEGGRVMIRHFKGARAIGFWSYFMFGLERNQQDEDPVRRQRTTFRVLKDRYTGQSTGQTFELGYDPDTGRIILPSALDMQPQTDSRKEGM